MPTWMLLFCIFTFALVVGGIADHLIDKREQRKRA